MSEDTFKLIDDSGYPNLSDFNDEEVSEWIRILFIKTGSEPS